MNLPKLYIAITNHGFGHATRSTSVAETIHQCYPDLQITLTTTAPDWLLNSYFPEEFIHRRRSFDIGVIQSDSMNMDKTATLEKLKHIRAQQAELVAAEAEFIRQNQFGLMLADIPPLVTQIAKAAGIPCWMMSNFGWDFIYRDWGGEFVEMADWIGTCFGECDRLFRLPFHEPMGAFPDIQDVGLTGGTPRYAMADLRSDFGLTAPKEQTVLLTFGGLGLAQIPYDNLARFPDWQFITFDRNAPDLPNLVRVMNAPYRPVDFMPLCYCLVGKPGYSTYAEACRMELPIISLTREGFAEAPVILEWLQDYTHHRIVQVPEFFEGDWDFLHQPFLPPRQNQPLEKNGNETIAQAIVDYFK